MPYFMTEWSAYVKWSSKFMRFVTLKVCGEIISKLQAKSELGAAQPGTLFLWGEGGQLSI
jgi:hypothetical protein